MAAYIRTEDHLTVIFDDGESATVYPSNPNYKQIVEAIGKKDFDAVRRLASPVLAVREKINKVVRRGLGAVELNNGVVYYNGEPLHNTLTERIVQMASEGFDIEPMTKFLENLQQNPSYRAVTELYGFLEKGNLPITEDGYFLAYKKVRQDYTDVHSGTFDNSVGQVVEMPRNKVNEDAKQTCSYGLHFCSRSYLGQFGGDRIMILKINPADVVAIPVDYNEAKGRCCRYEVIGELGAEEKLEGSFRPSQGYVEPDDEDYDYEDEDEYFSDDEVDSDYYAGRSEAKHDMAADGPLVQVINLENGDVIAEYPDIKDAAADYGVTPSAIRRVMKGERKSTGGVGWKMSDGSLPHAESLAQRHQHGSLMSGQPHGVEDDNE